jgi:hypothetical protein
VTVTADVLHVTADSAVDASGGTTVLTTTLANVNVNGKAAGIPDQPANTQVIIISDPVNKKFIVLTFNEQTGPSDDTNADGGYDTEGEVCALHAQVFDTINEDPLAEVFVACAHSDAHT